VYLAFVKFKNHLVLLSLVAAIGGCATSTNAIVQTMQSALGRGRGTEDAKLNPDFRYLRVTIGGRVVLLALGYLDKHPQGTIEVWYSAEREVVRLQNGRLVGAAGLTTEWRNVVLPDFPDWSALASGGAPLRWSRTRDVMPGYRYGLRDSLALHVVPPPPKSALQGLEPKELTWFEERLAGEALPKTALPAARYAVQLAGKEGIVVYGEQCLAPQTCFTWQRWPAGK
jgi:group 4 capsule polysaccharide lipoprotein GfcB/YjbF